VNGDREVGLRDGPPVPSSRQDERRRLVQTGGCKRSRRKQLHFVIGRTDQMPDTTWVSAVSLRCNTDARAVWLTPVNDVR